MDFLCFILVQFMLSLLNGQNIVNGEKCLQSGYTSEEILNLSDGYFGKLVSSANLPSASLDKACTQTTADITKNCENPPVFCPTSSCCLGTGQCGCWDDNLKKCRGLAAFRLKTEECSVDGLRVFGDYQIGLVTSFNNFSADLWLETVCHKNGGNAEIELGNDGQLGIRVSTVHCWNFTKTWKLLVGHSIRIEDPDGWLMEKFLLRILQHVSIGDLISEFGLRETAYQQELELILEQLQILLGSANDMQQQQQNATAQQNSKWGCNSELPKISMDSGFVPVVMGANGFVEYGTSNATGVKTEWNLCTDDRMVVKNRVESGFLKETEICGIEEEKATVQLEKENDDWSLAVTVNLCVYPQNFGTGQVSSPLYFSSLIKISEGNVYGYLVKAARQFVIKRKLKKETVTEKLKL